MNTNNKWFYSKDTIGSFEKINKFHKKYINLKEFYLSNDDEIIDFSEILFDWKIVSNDIVQAMQDDPELSSIFERLYNEYCKEGK